MHPQALPDHAAALLKAVQRFEQPADVVASKYFAQHRSLGPRERATVSDAVFGELRRLDLPDWLAASLHAQLGDELPAFVAAAGQPAPLDLRVNLVSARRAAVQEELSTQGIACEPTRYSPWGLRVSGKPSLARVDAMRRGAIEVQDEGSQLLALLPQARRGELVVDFCAGAGGKALALGASMRNTGRLYAFDTSAHRLALLQPRLERSELTNVHSAAIAHEADERVRKLAGKADRVLVDAPCSGLGTLRRHPDVKFRQSPATVAAFVERQLPILRAAAALVKPQGRLVYATCSLLREENEDIAAAFSAAQRGFRSVPVCEILLRAKVSDAATLCTPDGEFLRLWPHLHGTDGFFAAAWDRN